jgi:hypothetical protein
MRMLLRNALYDTTLIAYQAPRSTNLLVIVFSSSSSSNTMVVLEVTLKYHPVFVSKSKTLQRKF